MHVLERARGTGVRATGAPSAPTTSGAGAAAVPADGASVVVLHQEHAWQGTEALRRELAGALDAGASTIVVDVPGAQHLSSAVVALLLRAKRRCRARGGRVVLRGLDRHQLDVLHRTGLSPLFEIDGGR